MDRHQPNHVGRFAVGGRQRFVGLPSHELRKMRDEVGQREYARAIETPRLPDQLLKVGQLTLAEELGQQDRVVSGPRQCPADQLRDRQPVLDCPKFTEHLRRELHPLPLVPAQLGRQRLGRQPPRQSVRVSGQPKEALVEQAEQRAPQRAGQAHFVARIFERPQQVQQVVDLLLGVEGMSADQVVVDAVAAQCLFVVVDVGKRAEQQRHVAGADFPGRRLSGLGRLLVENDLLAGVEHCANSPGDPVGLAAPQALCLARGLVGGISRWR